MSAPIENPRPIRLGYDLEGNPVVARPEPEESLADFLERAQKMVNDLTELHNGRAAVMDRRLEETAARIGAQAKVAGTDPDLIEEYRQDSADCKRLAALLRRWDGYFGPILRLVNAMDHPELILPEEFLEWFNQTKAPGD